MSSPAAIPPAPSFPLQVFYDGACTVCAREFEHYRRHDRLGRLSGIDISAPGFDAAPYGIPAGDLMAELHAVDRRGNVYRGVDAFRAIWQAFPAPSAYGLLAGAVRLPVIYRLARLCYRVFARYRHYLPRHRPGCTSGVCRPGTH